ncbi:MAG TPA: hypothetical protein VF070_48410 [Streptosporangiaceae bacterium]
MYEMLSTRELTVLQSMLFEGAGDLHKLADLKRDDAGYAAPCRSAYREIAHLFIEAGTELIGRLDAQLDAA